jgi:hypothetical protein
LQHVKNRYDGLRGLQGLCGELTRPAVTTDISGEALNQAALPLMEVQGKLLYKRPDAAADELRHRFYNTDWLRDIEPLVPKDLQKSGISSIHGGPTF